MSAPTLRVETAGLIRLAGNDLAALWRMVAAGASAEVALRDLLPAIIEQHGQAGAAMAADWYDDLRDKAGVRGRFTAIPLEADDRGAQSLIGWALTTATDDASLTSLIAGGVQRRIADHARLTIAQSSVADPGARGWQRVARSDGCWFCRSIAGRGVVFTKAAAGFSSHDRCLCSATPAWGGRPVPVRPYTPSPRGVSEADRERFKKWASDNGLR